LKRARFYSSAPKDTRRGKQHDYCDQIHRACCGWPSSVVAPGGIELTNTMSITTGASGHLDGASSSTGLPSGLGSCLDLINGCIGKGTDDVDPGADLLTMNFVNDVLAAAQVVTITEMTIRDDFHLEFDGEIDVNGTVLTVVGGAVSGLNLVGSSFDFTWISGVDSGDVSGFYVETLTAQVPLPAGILLLGTALGGLGLARRRKAAA